jgi:hypothetical protein
LAEPESADADVLRARLDAAHAAAERLVREAEEAARVATRDVPERGWASPEPEGERERSPELQALATLIELARGALPPELVRQLAVALRELLLALRALIDYSLERLERPASGTPEVEDIPID